MKQSKLESFVEASVNTAMGFLVSLVIWSTMNHFHLFGLNLNHGQNLVIVSIFTVAAVARSYIVRRYFNAELHKVSIDVTRSFLKLKERLLK